MQGNKQCIIKGIFKREKKIFLSNFLLMASFFYFAALFISLFIKALGNGDFFAIILFLVSFLFLSFGVVVLKKELFLGFFKIELYENEMKIKDSFFKENTIYYKDIVNLDVFEGNVNVSTSEKNYSLSYLKNSFEISSFVQKKLSEIKRKRVLHLETEEKAYYLNKKRMVLKILIEFGIFAFAVVGIFVCVLLTEGRDTSDFTSMDKKIFVVFSIVETILMLSLFFYSKAVWKSILIYKDSKCRYSEVLSAFLIDRELSEKAVRVIKTLDSGRIVIYQSPSGAYKASFETFLLKNKSWYSYFVSDSYQLIEEIEEYLENFKEDLQIESIF